MDKTAPLIKIVFVVAALLSPFWFPLSATVVLALVGAGVSSFVPLAVGVLLDLLYWSRAVYPFPLYTLLGAVATLLALGVHRFIETSIMQR